MLEANLLPPSVVNITLSHSHVLEGSQYEVDFD